MEHWGIWDWTKFICCNHRPIEAGDHLHLYPHLKNGVNGQEVQDLVANSAATAATLYRSDNNYQYYYADNPIGYFPVNLTNDNHNIMDGLRLQLSKRKGVSLRSPPVRRSTESQVTLRGWLYRLEGAALKQWKRRWCVLADYCLFYYKDMEEEKLLGSLLLPSYKITPCLNDDGIARKFAFKAEHSNMKTYYFAADSKESQTQWMNSLSLASIMQFPNAFSTVRNAGDGQEVVASNDDEESGFASYQSRRSISGAISNGQQYEDNIGSGDKYPGSYNSVGLPVVYPQNLPHRPIQRSHYVNAPPKPKRQYYDNSDLYVIPPSAQYHSHSHPAPDLIAHDSYNSNYLPNNYFTQSYPPYEEETPQQFHLPPVTHTPRFSRLPPRPHSADFLERDQEEDEEENSQKIMSSDGYNGNAGHPDNYFNSQASEPPKIMPMRPKSSLERYDPYSRYYIEQQTNYVSPPNYPPVPSTVPQGKEPRPWSDYLVGASNNLMSPQSENQLITQTFSQSSSSHLPHYHSMTSNSYGLDAETPRNYQREESLQRLVQWKQRMLQSPLNKRNWTQQQQQSMQPQSTKQMELPSRPPLPEEYRSKFTMKDALKNAHQKDYPPPGRLQRERSKSIGDGSDFLTQHEDDMHSPQKSAPVNYSSDDEELNLGMPYDERHSEEHNDSMKEQSTPNYININNLVKDSYPDPERDSDLDISKEDYYKASTMFYQRSGRQSVLMSPLSFNESVSSKNDSIGHAFNKQDWADVGLPVPDEMSLSRSASRRSLKRLKLTDSQSVAQNLSPKREFNLEKREDGDGVDEYSVKCLLKKFTEYENKNLKLNDKLNETKSFNGSVENKVNSLTKTQINGRVNGNNVLNKSYVSDSEMLDNQSSTADEETNTSKSAPLMLSPLTRVLADLRKTADVRKERQYLFSRTQSSVTKPQTKVEEVVTKGALQLLDNLSDKSSALEEQLNCSTRSEQSDYLNMSRVVREDDYVAMDGDEADKESDAGDEADDEASRDFDSVNYQTDLITENDIKLKAGCKVRTYKKPRPEPVPSISSQFGARLSLNPNPAYETLGDIRPAKETDVKIVDNTNSNDSNNNSNSSDKQRSPSAPYYMSDLLSEEQQIALQEKLAARQTGSPPPLLSRCNALNNTRYLGTTSLQKCDIGKRVNNINVNKNDSPVVLNNSITNNLNNVVTSPISPTETIESSLKSFLLVKDITNVSKFMESERNKYEAGHTLQKVPQSDKSFPSYTFAKRCMTPDFDTRTDLQIEEQNSLLENNIALKRRSKSLDGLMDLTDQQHIYENLDQKSSNNSVEPTEQFFNASDDTYSDDDFMGTEVLRRVSKRHFADNFNSKFSSQSQQTVPLVESLEKSFDDYSNSDSDMSSLIELSIESIDSVSGPIMAEKVRKRRPSHKRRSKDDLNASDSEIQRPHSIPTKPMHVKPKSLREHKTTRLCVSTGDLLGKSHEELVLLLIQLRRTQSQIAKNCDQLRLQMESEEKMIEIEPHKREEHKLKFREVRELLAEYEKQYDMQFPLINTVDNMVKSSNPINSEDFSDNRAKAASTSVLDQVSYGEETCSLSTLQQDKEILERTLEGVKSKVAKIGTESGPIISLEKLKKQQRMIEGELSRVRGLLTHSAKCLEEKAAENAQIEQDVLMAKNKLKQVLANEEALESNKACTLEAELAHINQVIDDLHNRRVELNAAIESIKTTEKKREIVRASPTGLAGSIPLPGRKKITTTYMETDLDSQDTKDLAHYPRNSGSEGEGDTPLYENLENNNCLNANEFFSSQLQATEELLAANTEDILDEQMRQFYGINAAQKASEIKTVRIVKREAERRRIHFSNGSSKSMDSFWPSSQFDSDLMMSGGAVGGIGSIPPPYYYEDRDEDFEIDPNFNNFGQMDDCNDGKHCMIDSLNAEFRNNNLFTKQSFVSNDKPLSQSQPQQELFSRPERTRSASLSLPSTTCNSSALSSTPFPFRLTHLRRLESKYGRLSSGRRHHTISSSQPQLSETETSCANSISKMWRSRDDSVVDTRNRNTVNTPDIVKSTIKKNEDFDEKLIERELMLPKKIDIPERYIREDEPEEMSASEKLKRSMKAEMIRRRLSECATYEDLRRDTNPQQNMSSSSSSSAVGSEENGLSEETKSRLSEEKRRRAQLLALNHELAKEVMERSRIVAVLATLAKFDDNCYEKSARFDEIKSLSEMDLIEMIEKEWPQTDRTHPTNQTNPRHSRPSRH